MCVKCVGIVPLPRSLKIKCANIKQISLVDDVVSAGKVKSLNTWWDELVSHKKMVTMTTQKILDNIEI